MLKSPPIKTYSVGYLAFKSFMTSVLSPEDPYFGSGHYIHTH